MREALVIAAAFLVGTAVAFGITTLIGLTGIPEDAHFSISMLLGAICVGFALTYSLERWG